MAGTLFRLFLIFMGISHLICLKAVPVTRTESLMQGPHVDLTLENTHKVITEKKWRWTEPTIAERMDLELDYAPPGANGHHTPRAP